MRSELYEHMNEMDRTLAHLGFIVARERDLKEGVVNIFIFEYKHKIAHLVLRGLYDPNSEMKYTTSIYKDHYAGHLSTNKDGMITAWTYLEEELLLRNGE